MGFVGVASGERDSIVRDCQDFVDSRTVAAREPEGTSGIERDKTGTADRSEKRLRQRTSRLRIILNCIFKSMNISQIESIVKYITNAEGEKTEAIIPIELWLNLLKNIPSMSDESIDSGLDSVDENEPKSQIIADLQTSIRAVKAGEVYPVSQLWDELDD